MKSDKLKRFGPLAAVGLIVIVVAIVVLTRGGSDDSGDIPSAGSSNSGQTSSTKEAPSAQAYTDCMRDQGVEMKDPDAANGMPQFGDSVNPESAQVQAASDACSSLLPSDVRGDSENTDLGPYLAFANCMRQNGFPDFPDPQPSDNGMFPDTGIDRSDPAYIKATDACGDTLTGAGE